MSKIKGMREKIISYLKHPHILVEQLDQYHKIRPVNKQMNYYFHEFFVTNEEEEKKSKNLLEYFYLLQYQIFLVQMQKMKDPDQEWLSLL